MASSNDWTAQMIDHTRRLGDYKETVRRLFPTLPRTLVDAWSIKDVDALVLALFLECYPHGVAVLEARTFVGASAFHFARQPKVSRVVSVDPNSSITDEVGEMPEILDRGANSEPLPELRVLDIVGAALAEFADENAKVQLETGTLRSALTGHQGDSSSEKTGMPGWELTEGEPLLAFVRGVHTREAVDADLEAVFESSTHAIAILDGCRGSSGPFVQAGLASFIERAKGEYHFRLFGDLSHGMATSNLGIIHSDVDSEEVQRSLEELSYLFSERLDPLWLAGREQELIGTVNMYKDEADNLLSQHQNLINKYQLLADRKAGLQSRVSQLEERNSQLEKRKSQLEERKSQLEERKSQLEERKSQLEERNSQLEERNSQLEERNSQLKGEKALLNSQLGVYRAGRRYKVANAVAENVLRIPGARALTRRNRPEQ